MSEIDQLFGNLRSMVQSNQRALQFQLLQLLEQAYLLNPERYEEQWRPYLSAFKLPMIRVLSEKMFEKVCLYTPDDIRLSLMLKNMNERPLNDILGHPRAQYVEGLLLRRTSITLAVANNIASMPNLAAPTSWMNPWTWSNLLTSLSNHLAAAKNLTTSTWLFRDAR